MTPLETTPMWLKACNSPISRLTQPSSNTMSSGPLPSNGWTNGTSRSSCVAEVLTDCDCSAPRTAAVSENVGISCRGSRRCVGWRAGASRSVAEVLAVLGSSSDGLDADTACERLTVYGANKLPAKEPRPAHVRRLAAARRSEVAVGGHWSRRQPPCCSRSTVSPPTGVSRYLPRCSSPAVRFWLLSLPA